MARTHLVVICVLVAFTLSAASERRVRRQSAFCAGYGQRCNVGQSQTCCTNLVCNDNFCGTLSSRTAPSSLDQDMEHRKFRPSPIKSAEGRR